MHGQIIINNVDIYDEYKASPLRGTYATLQGTLTAKDCVSNKSRLENGVRYVVVDEQKLNEREISIDFAVEGVTEMRKFIKFLRGGMLAVYVPKLGETYQVLFVSLDSVKTYLKTDLRTITIKFKEPDPTNRY